jgi:hypothetical protein
MREATPSENIVVAAATGYREEQLRPFLASLRHFSPCAPLRLIVERSNPEFEMAVRAWFPGCSFYPLPPSPLRDFGLRYKWARSILKRVTRWSRSRRLARRLVKINFLRHIVLRDLLLSWKLEHANILFCDSRDVVFQADPFAGDWAPLWTGEEDKRIEECHLNSLWLQRVGGKAALRETKHERIVCVGVVGGRVEHIYEYFQRSGKIVERLAPDILLVGGDQGIHNYLVRFQTDLGFTVMPNGNHLALHVAYTSPADLRIENDLVGLRNRPEVPAILHQYDRHPQLAALVQSRWANVRLE